MPPRTVSFGVFSDTHVEGRKRNIDVFVGQRDTGVVVKCFILLNDFWGARHFGEVGLLSVQIDALNVSDRASIKQSIGAIRGGTF
jgi:hypothetical protein